MILSSAFSCDFYNNGIHLHHGSGSFSSSPLIITIPNLVLDDILARKGATKGGKTKSRKSKFQQFLVFSVTKKGLVQNFDNLHLIELSLFNSIVSDLLLINEELCLHECIFDFDPL
jgi:hypothetical protein